MRSEELQCFDCSQEIIRMIKSRMVHVACMGEKKNAYEVLMGNPDGFFMGGRSVMVGQKEKCYPAT